MCYFMGKNLCFVFFSASLSKESNIPKMETLAKSNFLFKNDILCKNEFKLYSKFFLLFSTTWQETEERGGADTCRSHGLTAEGAVGRHHTVSLHMFFWAPR